MRDAKHTTITKHYDGDIDPGNRGVPVMIQFLFWVFIVMVLVSNLCQ